jgi:hypothetical protein
MKQTKPIELDEVACKVLILFLLAERPWMQARWAKIERSAKGRMK